MNFKKIIRPGALISVTLTIIICGILYFQNDANAIVIQSALFLMFSSILLVANYALYEYVASASSKLKKSLTIINLCVIGFGILTFFNILPFKNLWHILVGAGILFLLAVQLQILGWSKPKHNILTKIIYALVLMSNLFLAALFIFKLDYYQLNILVYITTFIGIASIFYGIYFCSSKTPEKDILKV